MLYGGSGAGKSASYVIPNALQLLGSYVFTDPKGELLTPEEFELLRNGIKTKLKLMLNYFEKTEKIEPATFLVCPIELNSEIDANDA